MGGWGSGGSWGFGKRKCEDALPLDVRKLKRKGCLIPGRSFSWQWSVGGNVHSTIGFKVYEQHVTLNYNHRKEPVEQQILFEWTPCNYGGERAWWRCPRGRRCAVVYGAGKLFSCRVCYSLAYSSTCETGRDRKFRRANELRRKIGAKAKSLNRLPIFKPKGMHQKTWDRIIFEIKILEHQG